MRELSEECGEFAQDAQPLIVLNKIDLLEEPPPLSNSTVVAVSALARLEIDALLAAIAQRLVPNALRRGDAVPFTDRQCSLLESALTAIKLGNPMIALSHLSNLVTGNAGDGRCD
jgi:50S ribosomal subunit-associated GTPase HflX